MIQTALQKGMSVRGACRMAGIDKSTYYQWLQDKPDFKDMVEAAQGIAENLFLDMAIEACDYRFILPRRFKDDYSERTEQQVDSTVRVIFEYSEDDINQAANPVSEATIDIEVEGEAPDTEVGS